MAIYNLPETQNKPLTPRFEVIHEAFQQQATRTPEAVALVFQQQRQTYAELELASDVIAAALKRAGVNPGDIVGVALPRSLELIGCLLGVLKAGAAYLPLDIQYPREHLAQVLADAAPSAVLSTAEDAQALGKLPPSIALLDITCLPDSRVEPEQPQPTGNNVQPGDNAYVIYTSGSTGRPKGVLVTHHNVLRLLSVTQPALGFGNEDTWVLFHSYAFDFSVWEIWGALLTGATLVIVPYTLSRSPREFLQLLVEQRVTILNQTPSAFYQLDSTCEAQPQMAAKLNLRCLIFGGEALDFGRLKAWRRRHGDRPRLINMYGITETTVHVTLLEICADSSLEIGASLVGEALGDLSIHLLDEQLQPVTTGTVGQIYVSGAGLSRGYLNRPSLTAERFVACPFSDNGQRMYRSGDLARQTDSGDLEYLGRADDQVKIRGHRIEPGEIATHLLEHPQVKAAAVIARANELGSMQLLGYVVPQTEVSGSLVDQQVVDSWQAVYEETYRHIDAHDNDSAFEGWNSSYDQQPLPLEEMRSWLHETLASIRRLSPRNVLEIGVGSGLILREIACETQSYWGIDLSAVTIANLRQVLDDLPHLRDKVTLYQGAAHQLRDLPPARFDTIIINSVAQYFPSLDYLDALLRQLQERLAPGGHLFIGDVRNHDLLSLFATGVIARRNRTTTISCVQATAAIDELVAHENELTIHPDYFCKLARQADNVFGGIDIRLKQAREINELTQYRYDVVLHTEGVATFSLAEAIAVEWGVEGDPLGRLITLLATEHHDSLRLRGVPYVRVAKEVAWQRSLAEDEPWPDMAVSILGAPDLQHLCSLGAGFGYQGAASWSSLGCEQIDILFWRAREKAFPVGFYQRPATELTLANRPRRAQAEAQLRTELQQWLQERLPLYMQPHAIIAVQKLPLTPNGKLDKRALPAPPRDEGLLPEHAESPLEAALLRLFCNILERDGMGLSQSFFQLGGDSLSAVALAAAIRRELSTEVTVGDIFEAPSIKDLASRLQIGAQTRPALESGPRPERIPLSNAQRRLWLIAQIEAGQSSYNIPLAFDIKGDLVPDVLEGALDDLLHRHEVLRTLIVQDQEGPYQKILPPGASMAPLIYRQCAPEELSTSLSELARQPFDLTQELPLRAILFEIEHKHSVLLLVAHHIALDGWSIAPLLQELSLHYRSRLASGRPAELAPLAIQYADYTLWQQRLLGTAKNPTRLRQEQQHYWCENLHGAPPVLNLPGAAHRPRERSGNGGACIFSLEKPLVAVLQEIARRQHSTLFMVLHTAVLALLTRLGCGNDLSIGVALAGRAEEGLKDSIGLFVNTLVIRTVCNDNSCFTELLQQVREASLGAHANQDLPFDSLVEAVAPSRSLSHHPLFQVLLTLQDTRTPALDLPGASLSQRAINPQTSRFDWALDFCPIPGQGNRIDHLECRLEYSSDLFEHSDMQTLCERFVGLLNAIAESPQQPITHLELRLDHERQAFPEYRSGPDLDLGTDNLYTQFDAQVQRRPDSIALLAGDATLRYAELGERVEMIARHLQRASNYRRLLVGIALGRTTTMVATLLACLKTGTTYLPLDLGYPLERLQQIINDANVDMILGDRPGHALAQHLGDAPWENVEQWLARPLPATSAPWPYDPHHPAYLLYTSGSTGRPKGVLVKQRSLLNLLVSMGRELGISDADTLLACTPISFDISALELFLPLINGASLHLSAADVARDPTALAQYIDDIRPTLMQATPTLWQMLCDAGWKARSPLKILCGGEALPEPLAKRLSLEPGHLYNLYGPTETTIWSMICKLAPGRPPCLGSPVANTRIQLLDLYLKPVLPGVLGEICIAGEGVAVGYLNNPAMTAERFIADPLGPPGTRLYRTGDLGRWSASGELLYCGRRDAQVKLRGHRIELGDIESALCDYPGITQALAALRQDSQSRPVLVAHVMGEPDTTLDIREIRRFLIQRLPDYMIPALIGQVADLPLTPSGKTDRMALALPSPNGSGVPSHNALEQKLIRLFERLLGINGVGREDNFFDLGGDSALAVALARQFSEQGHTMHPADVFQAQTVRALVQRVAPEENIDPAHCGADVLLHLTAPQTTPALFCFHPKEGVGLRFANLLPHLDADQALYAFQSSLLGNNPQYADSIEALAQHYLDELRQVQPHGPYRLLGWSFGGLVAYQAASQLLEEGEKVELLALLDAAPCNDGLRHFTKPAAQARTYAGELENASHHHLALMTRWTPPPTEVEVLFFSCGSSEQPEHPAPGEWQRLTGRPVTTWHLDCKHGEMLDPHWAPVIAHVIRAYLATPDFTPEA